MPDSITSFTGEYHFLSNFSYSPFLYQAIAWPTAEHAYQAMKRPDQAEWLAFPDLPTPAAVKKAGRAGNLRRDWESVKRRIMLEILLAKFSQNGELYHRLTQTAGHELVEGNTWKDTYWGAVPLEHSRRYETTLPVWDGMTLHGHNWLGRCLMMAREVLS